jgi:hypothetical protein
MGRPLLAFGSQGPTVKLLQQALNWAASKLARLEEDGIFGPLTRNRVCEFQSQHNLDVDGVVGPETWGKLEPLIDQLAQGITDMFGKIPAAELELRNRVVQTALMLHAQFGWPAGVENYAPQNPRIAANKMASNTPIPGHPGYFPRQGGVSLATIFRMVGARESSKCLMISQEAYDNYHWTSRSKRPKPTPSTWRNQLDIPSWCGIFALYCLKISGVKVPGWNGSSLGVAPYTTRTVNAQPPPQPGDIALRNEGMHHMIIVEVRANNQLVTIEGNEGVYQSIIRKETRNCDRLTNNPKDKVDLIVTPPYAAVAGAG